MAYLMYIKLHDREIEDTTVWRIINSTNELDGAVNTGLWRNSKKKKKKKKNGPIRYFLVSRYWALIYNIYIYYRGAFITERLLLSLSDVLCTSRKLLSINCIGIICAYQWWDWWIETEEEKKRDRVRRARRFRVDKCMLRARVPIVKMLLEDIKLRLSVGSLSEIMYYLFCFFFSLRIIEFDNFECLTCTLCIQ